MTTNKFRPHPFQYSPLEHIERVALGNTPVYFEHPDEGRAYVAGVLGYVRPTHGYEERALKLCEDFTEKMIADGWHPFGGRGPVGVRRDSYEFTKNEKPVTQDILVCVWG